MKARGGVLLMRISLLGVVLLLFGAPRVLAGPPYAVGGTITPEHFRFYDVVPHTGREGEPGGIACTPFRRLMQ